MTKNILIAHEWGFTKQSIKPLADSLTGKHNIYIIDSNYYNKDIPKLPKLKESETIAIGFGLGFAKLFNISKKFAKYVCISSLANFNCSEQNSRHVQLLETLIKQNKSFEALNGFLSRSGISKYEAAIDSINNKSLLTDLELMKKYDFTKEVLNKEINLLAISGDKDFIVDINDFNKQFKNNEKIIINNAKHNLIIEDSKKIVKHIKDFI